MPETPKTEEKPKTPTDLLQEQVNKLSEEVQGIRTSLTRTNDRVSANRRNLAKELNRQRLWIEAFVDPILKDYRNDRGESVLDLLQSERYK
jgi:hypothetical protein